MGTYVENNIQLIFIKKVIGDPIWKDVFFNCIYQILGGVQT